MINQYSLRHRFPYFSFLRQGLVALILSLAIGPGAIAQDLHIMVITGGHDFDSTSFFGMFDSFSDFTYEHVVQPEANDRIGRGEVTNADVLVFYDMYQSITKAQQAGYQQLVANRKPMVFLHHSLVSYQDWPWFAELVGGRYYTLDSTRLSNYQHDVKIEVEIADPAHPITRNLEDFTILDETYGNCSIAPTVKPLLKTDHPQSMPLLGWINSIQGHEVVYLQGGHGPTAFQDPNFRRLLLQSLLWSTRNMK